MRAATYHDRKDIRVEDVERHVVEQGQVRIDIDSCGICGSELHKYTVGPIFAPPLIRYQRRENSSALHSASDGLLH